MLPVEEILITALKEHDYRDNNSVNVDEYIQRIKGQLDDPSSIRPYSRSSTPLSLVSFKCLLQDTGYPMEVYLPGTIETSGNVDWSKLKERWVGWGVEIPGEQTWAKGETDLSHGLQGLSIEPQPLPPSVHTKYPLPSQKGEYLGALLKVYGDASFKPASTHEFIGLFSYSPMPSNEPEEADIVPTIHVLSERQDAATHEVTSQDEETREELLDYLATAFNPPDRTAAEYLLLLLLSSPTARPTSLPVLGTLSLNFRHQASSTTSAFNSVISSVSPRVVPLPLTIPLLHSHPFSPNMTDTTGLNAGLLQLGEGTVLVVDEDAMGDGGALSEKALGNLKALIDCVKDQKIKYEYPYMDGLKMDCAIRVAVLSQGKKSLLPVDVDISLREDGTAPTKPPALEAFRSYLARYSSPTHASRLVIPDETSQLIQDHFVQERKSSAADAEETLKRRMKVARIVALSYPHATLNKDVWERTVRLDQEVAKRHTMS
ncbi:hypothetical protein I352_03498 [Cryptococcus deuterogattii MMRL2647]|nr:hypothetical protein I352_03498 [Cryptococcus deuterogattii MMRL2647]